MDRTLEHLLAVVEGDAHDYRPSPDERRLAQDLIELEQEEAEVSALRRRLHDRLGSFPNPETEVREREVSAYRAELHQRIKSLRAELEELGWVRKTVGKGRTGRDV